MLVTEIVAKSVVVVLELPLIVTEIVRPDVFCIQFEVGEDEKGSAGEKASISG